MTLKTKIVEKARDYVAGVRGALSLAKKTGLVLLVTNASAFSTVAMEKGISGYSIEQASVVNSTHAVPLLYRPGFEIGHLLFYGDENFLGTKDRALKF